MTRNTDMKYPEPVPEDFRKEDVEWFVNLLREYKVDLASMRKLWNQSLHTTQEEKEKIVSTRWDHELIYNLIPTGARVLDCGSGSGDLLRYLIDHNQVKGQGIELNESEVQQAVQKGVPVIQADLDIGLDGFGDDIFDYVILERTLQTVKKPISVLKDMLRVGRIGIVSFPNFGHWENRLQLFLVGKMPKTKTIPYAWHETPNIHHLSIRDFLETVHHLNFNILQGFSRNGSDIHPFVDMDDLLAEEALFVLSR